MIKQYCPICGLKAKRKLIYQQNFKIDQINQDVFSARRPPDRIHYKTVQCQSCGLVYADSVLNNNQLSKLYKTSLLTYQDQIPDLTKTYGYYLKKLENYKVRKNSLLEIGCGNGFFLQEAKRQGFKEVWGVEPSLDAIKQAPKFLQKHIKHAMFQKGLFKSQSFDVICFFQTFDHVSNPNQFLKDCFRLLKPGGLILAINHNFSSFQARILKDKSPIIDVEHPYLYNLKTMRLIFKKNNFEIVKIASVFNYYPLDYIFRLLSINLSKPSQLLTKIKLKFWLGNLMMVAKKNK